MPKRWVALCVSVGLTAVVTGAMSLVFHSAVRVDFMATGLVCALFVTVAVDRLTRGYRLALRRAHRERLDAAARALELEAAQRASLEHQLESAERMATAGTVAAAVCHEVRNPLTAISCNLELAELYLGRGPDARAELGTAIQQAGEGVQQACAVISDLATLATPANEFEAVELVEAIASARRLSAHELGDVALEIDVEDELVVMASRPRLIQVFVNLMCNAAQASAAERRNRISITAGVCGPDVEIRIDDTGVGIDSETLERIFEPFYTTRHGKGGTGLGLAICRSIIVASGGEMSIASRPGEGTTVVIRVPVASADTARPGREASA